MMHPIPDILDDLRAGRMVVLVDDETRENEGDIICAAQFVNPQVINFMLREGRGMLFVSLDGGTCDRLDLPLQTNRSTTQRGTAYTLTVDASAALGITTGVSASDRAATILRLVDPAATAGDFDRPGHVQPLRARDGGVLVRAGHTEGMVDLCRLAGLRPGAVGIEVMNPDGSMARRAQLQEFCARHQLKMTSIAELIQYRLSRENLVQRVDTAPFETECGLFTLIAYRSRVDPLPHVALVCGPVGRRDDAGGPIDLAEPVLVRMHSQNLLGDVFGDLAQPSGKALRIAMRTIQRAGAGAVVYLRHESMGTGLLRRLQTLHLEGHAPAEVRNTFAHLHETPGVAPPRDKAAYGVGSQILRDLGVRRLRLLTNHPFHPTALEGFGLSIVEFVPIPEEE